VTSKSSKLLHLDPLAIALEKKRKREEEAPDTSEPILSSQPNMSCQLTEQPPGGPVGWQLNMSSQPNTSSQPILDNQTVSNPLNLLASVPDIKGDVRVPHKYSDYLCRMLKPDEQAVYWQLYRLSWGWGKDSCFISNPKLSERSNVPLSSMKRAVAGLISKGLIAKTGQSNGFGKDQGVEYRLPILDWQPNTSSQPILSSQPNMAPIKVNTLNTHTQTPVGVGSRYTLEECRAFADSLRHEGIQNPGGYATAIHRSGEADPRIGEFLKQCAQEPGRPELDSGQIQEQANLVASMLRRGTSSEEVERLMGGDFRPAQWRMIRSIALAQAAAPAPEAQDPEQ